MVAPIPVPQPFPSAAGVYRRVSGVAGYRAVQGSEDYDPATTRYIRAGASGSNNGTDWTNAYTSIPSSLTRGYTYFVADGSYGSYTFDDAVDGTKVITLKKATGSSHGTSTGWDAGYGDGIATLGNLTVRTSYYTVDGSTRNESDWKDVDAYGFRFPAIETNSSQGTVGSHIVVRYCDLGGTWDLTPSDATIHAYDQAVYRGFSGITDWTVSRCCLHNTITAILALGVDGDVIEYCWIGNDWGKEAIRGSYGHKNVTIRHNTFWRASGRDPLDPSGGITGDIAIWTSDTEGDFDNIEIYGNTFWNDRSEGRNCCIVVGGDDVFWAGVGGANTKVWNNTFSGYPEAGTVGMIDLNGTNTSARNNLFYDTAGTGIAASTTSNNIDASTDPFVDYAAYDFHIEASSDADGAGADLGTTPYDVDRDGVSREGNWSVGAYEVA